MRLSGLNSLVCICQTIHDVSFWDLFCVSSKGGTGGGGLVHPKVENTMAVSGFGCVHVGSLSYLVGPPCSIQGWFISKHCLRNTFTNVLRNTECNLGGAIQSIYSPDYAFTVLVSIFINKPIITFGLPHAHCEWYIPHTYGWNYASSTICLSAETEKGDSENINFNLVLPKSIWWPHVDTDKPSKPGINAHP